MIGEAKAAGAHTMSLSSENLEGVVFNPEIALLIERVAADHGFDEIEWHAVIREPGAYFESLHSQLSWHTYVASLTTFSVIMKKGVLFLPEPKYGDRKSVVEGRSVSVRVDLGCRRIIKIKTNRDTR